MARNFTLADVFNAGADFASTVATIQDRQLKEKAETDLLYMQAQVDSAASAFMQDLAQRNDYSNWQKDLDSFISRQGNKLQKESANAYTAKRAQEMMLRYRGELEQKVQLEALAKHKESVATTDEMTLQLIRNSFSGQDRLNKTGQVYDKEYATGVIDENNYVAKKINEATATANDMYYKKYTTEIDNAIENGESLESVIARFEKDDIQLEIKALDSASANPDVLGTDKAVYKDISSSLDKKGIKDKLKPALQQYGKLKIAEVQNGDAKKLADIYALCQTSTGNDRAINIKSGKNLLKTFVGTNKLSEDDTVRYSNLFDALEDDLNKTGGKMIGSSGTKAFKAAIGVDPKGFIEAWRRGSLSAEGGFSSLYAAKEAYKSAVADELKKAGKTTEEIEKFLANDNGYNTLVREGAEIIFNSLEYGVLKADLAEFQKSIIKGDYPKEAHGYLVDWVLDRIAQSDMSKTSFDDVYNDYEKMKSVVTSKKLDKMFVLKNTKDKSIGEMSANLDENDIVHTDIHGNVRWMPGTEKLFSGEEGIGVQFGKVVSQATGKEDLQLAWKQTDNGTDITNIPVFKDSDGNSYTVEPVYKNNNKEKGVTGYRVVDQNGNEYKTEKESLKKEDDKKRKEFDKKKKEYRENFIKNEEEKR
ncbi:MAG: hypothetical protein II232_00720, partial [Spirochaetaceae bacterium]|nr:hypothetical protein [Spirochaetaceae bacterium]